MKLKPILVVVVILIIGFVLGMLTSAQLRFHRMKPVSVYFSEDRFRDGFYRTIEPDEKQKAKIDLVLDKYAKINSELQGSFRKELDSYLTKDQLARLKDMDEKRQEMIRQNRKNHDNDTSRSRNGRNHGPDGRAFPEGMQRPPLPAHDSIPANR